MRLEEPYLGRSSYASQAEYFYYMVDTDYGGFVVVMVVVVVVVSAINATATDRSSAFNKLKVPMALYNGICSTTIPFGVPPPMLCGVRDEDDDVPCRFR